MFLEFPNEGAIVLINDIFQVSGLKTTTNLVKILELLQFLSLVQAGQLSLLLLNQWEEMLEFLHSQEEE